MRATPVTILTAVCLAAGACHIDKLVEPAPDRVLTVTPASAALQAVTGSAVEQQVTLAVGSARSDSVSWTARRTGTGMWLTFDDSTGSTPDVIHLIADPTGLAAGTYRDTVLVAPVDPDLAAVRVPVTFIVTDDQPGDPDDPEGLGQFRTDSSTPLSVGGITTEAAFVVAATVRDADPGDSLRLEVEVLPLGAPFGATATAIGLPVATGARATVLLSGLTDTTSYHWRARVTDQSGRSSAWRSFGGNPESAADLKVALAATRLAFQIEPATTTAGAAITPAIQVVAVDAEGHPIASFTGTVSVVLSDGVAGATLSGDREVSAVAGVATFSGLSVDRSGSGYHLRASSTGLVEATSAAFAITAGAATHLTFTQQPTTTALGQPITPAVRVSAWDAQGNLATGYTGAVTVSLENDGSLLKNATLSGVRTAAAAAGVVSFTDLSLDQPGTGFTLRAEAPSLTGMVSAPFAISPIGGTPTEQAFTTEPSNAQAGEAITPPVEVTIFDALGAPVTDFLGSVTLLLEDDPGGATLSGTRTIEVTEGRARFGDLSLDRPASGYRLRAVTAGLSNVVSAPFDITAPPPTTGELTVAAATTGEDLDADGYSVTVDANGRAIGVNGSSTFSGLAAGDHVVSLGGLAGNCSLTGINPRTVTVPAGGTVRTEFSVTCASEPPPSTPATMLSFSAQPPAAMIVGGNFGISVEALTSTHVRATGYTGAVTLSLQGGLLGVTLTGTTRRVAVDGVASFPGLGVSGPCVSCRIQATASGLSGATSDPFTVVIP